MRIGAVAFGSRGDIHPILGLAGTLTSMGHDVSLFASEEDLSLVDDARLNAFHIGGNSFHSFLASHRYGDTGWHAPLRLLSLLRDVAIPTAHRVCEAIISSAERFDALLAPNFQYGAMLAAELTATPLISTTNRSIAALCSQGFGRRADATTFERAFAAVDRLATAPLNRLRVQLGLPERAHAATLGSVSDDAVLVLTSRVLEPDASRWPAHFVLSRYPAYDGGANHNLSREVQTFLHCTDDQPLVVCTLGDSWAQALPSELREVAEPGSHAGYRTLVLAGRGPLRPTSQAALTVSFAPLSQVLPHAAAIVHHGGTGTFMRAMRAGVPAVIMPHWLDAIDNAEQARRCGFANVVHWRDLSSSAVTRALDSVLGAGMRARARQVAREAALDPELSTALSECISLITNPRNRGGAQ